MLAFRTGFAERLADVCRRCDRFAGNVEDDVARLEAQLPEYAAGRRIGQQPPDIRALIFAIGVNEIPGVVQQERRVEHATRHLRVHLEVLECNVHFVALRELGDAAHAHELRLLLRRDGGYAFDIAYTSVLKRAIRTLWIALDELDRLWLPVEKSWRLNERHYGALQGLNKAETAAKHGEAQTKIWRRSYDIPPPALDVRDERHPSRDRRYAHLASDQLPLTESLKDTVARFVPYWLSTIGPDILSGRRVIIAAHGNSLRALVKHLDGVSEADIVELNIPTGIPLVYELDGELRPIRHYYLGDAAAAEAAAARVANQTKG